MKKLVFVVHNHQPVGNFDYVFREAFEKSYKPFIDLVFELEYPKVCFHFSGIVYEWINKNEPSYIEKLKKMLERNQIEILSGGYYEPILGVIPFDDAISQLRKLNNYIFKTFNFMPQGAWLTERVFTPEIVEIFARSGIGYTIIDDTHILNCGVDEREVNNCFITERYGNKLKLFIINHNLRYLIPYKEPYKTVEYINQFEEGIFVMADDGEKFGLWPESYKLVYEEKYLYNFFQTIKNSGIDMVRLMDVADRKPKRLIYVPESSYFELSQWALDADNSIMVENFRNNIENSVRKFVKGGIFSNFFTKYRQSNLIHKRVFYVSSLVNKNYDPLSEDFLHKAECNCGWWHGVFGGIYLPHIRLEIYKNLLAAQKIIFNKSSHNLELKTFDIDSDGNEEIVVESKNNFFIFSPSYGGSIVEFSSKNTLVNYSSIMDRRKEAYHIKPPANINGKNVNIDFRSFIYDWHHRSGLLDHFLNPSTTIDNFLRVSYAEDGDFIPQNYIYNIEFSKKTAKIKLSRDGFISDKEGRKSFSVCKTIMIDPEKDGFHCEYILKNTSSQDINVAFLVELVFAFSSINVAPLKEVENVVEYIFKDEFKGNIRINISTPLKLWIIPVETISNSENGLEKTYQGSIVGIKLDRHFALQEEYRFSFDLEIL